MVMLGRAAHRSRYSLQGGMPHTASPSLQMAMAERTRNGPIGDWIRSSDGVVCAMLGKCEPSGQQSNA